MTHRIPKRFLISFFISVATGVIYYFSDPHPHFYYDYTFRVAGALLHGRLGIIDIPPSWLNEFIPAGDQFFSAFPLGSVLTMLPFAAMEAAGLISAMPGAFAAALSASVICWLLLLIAERYVLRFTRRMLMVTGIVFGTWLWVKLTLAGAWQLALGFGMIG